MADQEVISSTTLSAQPRVWDRLSQIGSSEQLGSAYLFSGPPGCGKEGIALQFAQLLNCESGSDDSCGNCPSCKRFFRLQHENLKLIFPLPTPKKNTDRENTGIDQKDLEMVTDAIAQKSGDPFFKMQIPRANRILIQSIRELRKSLYLKSETSGRKMVLIFDAHLLSSGQGEAANALLKLLEEPPESTTIVLVTDYIELLLPTILSRCQRIRFPRLDDSYIQNWFEMKMIKNEDIPYLTGLSRGNLHQARFLISQPVGDLMTLIRGLIKTITQDDPDQWRKFTQTYSKLAKQDQKTFSFHFIILKIWFQSANRFQKNLDDLLHHTSFKPGMERMIKAHPDADFSAVAFALEDAANAIPQNLYMPLVLINLLLHIQKHLKS
ncbi:MAG: AAA family ATPase [Candidatus Neomarinimicrobiota bacterium]|nr:AAA family ATPase [Candidatus Neomarinimicrobiota bacterium]